MNASEGYEGWGQWVWKRASFLGIRSRLQLARDIGCTPQHMSILLKMDAPPARMRKGIDKRLSAVLRTDAQTLFTGWANVDPTAIPLAPAASPAPSPGEGDEENRRAIQAVVLTIGGAQLRRLRELATALAAGQSV